MNNNDMNIAIRFAVAGGQVVVKDINGITQSTTTATKSLKQLDTAGSESAKGLSKAANSSKQLSTALQENRKLLAVSLAGSLRSMVGVTAGLYAAFQSLTGIKALIERADDFNVLQQRIRTATAETNDYNTVSAEMYAIAQRNGAALAPTVELFQRLSTSRKDLKATNAQMLDFTDAVQKLGVIGGSSTTALEAGLMQLSQGLSGGVLRAEEFNSLLGKHS
ncbi:MAG: tape measure protein [Rheinheimera sp.]|nr:tape measure protein [Rheinheimera sp.]